jgi:hypothetical protein
MSINFWLENLKRRQHSENLHTNGRITLQWMREQDWNMWLGPVAGSCEYGNEPLGSTKGKIS